VLGHLKSRKANDRNTVCVHATVLSTTRLSSSSAPPNMPTEGRKEVLRKRRKFAKQAATGHRIVLMQGAIQPGNFTDVAAACETVFMSVGESGWTKKNSTKSKGSSRTFHIRCMSEKTRNKDANSPGLCPFACNAVEGDKNTPPGQARITEHVSHHLCSHGQDRQRAVKLNVRMAQSLTLDGFIPVAGRRGGNAKQLQQTLLQQDGICMKETWGWCC
jgi:hypothetical protein